MITLYSAPSSAGLVVHWLFIELEIPHTLHKLDLAAGDHKQPAYLALNPAGVVPTLVIDGQPVTEAAAIALHLVDAYPARGFAPAPGTLARAAYYQWMFFLANTMQPAFRGWFYPAEPAGEANADAAKLQARADRGSVGTARHPPRGARPVPARRQDLHAGLPVDDAHAVVAQHAKDRARVAGPRAARRGDEGAAGVQGSLRARRSDRLDVSGGRRRSRRATAGPQHASAPARARGAQR